MSLGFEQNYMDKLKAKNMPAALRSQETPPVPMVQISAEDWEKLQALLKEMRLTSGQMASQDRGYLSAAMEYKRTMLAAAQEQTEASKKAIEKLTKEEKALFESMRHNESFKPNPTKEDKSFFEKLKDLF